MYNKWLKFHYIHIHGLEDISSAKWHYDTFYTLRKSLKNDSYSQFIYEFYFLLNMNFNREYELSTPSNVFPIPLA